MTLRRGEICLAIKRPDLIAEWHSEKNGNLTPYDVSFGSNKKAWWICEKGHEWHTVINNRNRGAKCPYCTHHKVLFDHSLECKFPDLAKEYHPTKNTILRPSEISSSYTRKIWWICENGHDSEKTISGKLRDKSCHFCVNSFSTKANNLQVLYPDIAEEWHFERNPGLFPENFLPFSNKRVWWKCSENHEWMTSIRCRSKGHRCPICAGNKPSPERNLKVIYPNIAKTWHLSKNIGLTPLEISPKSNRKVWWKCDFGHEWRETVANRTSGCECPYCSGRRLTPERSLAVMYPKLVEDWHTSLNGKLTPYEVTYGSRKRVWWRCRKGHEWCIPVKDRSKGDGCPYCSGLKPTPDNNFRVRYPDEANAWHPTKNGSLKPEDCTPGSDRKVWFKCDKGHEWERSIYRIKLRTGCPFCSGKKVCSDNSLKALNPTLACEWHTTKNGLLTPELVRPKSNIKVWWECEYAHIWEATIKNRSNGSGCPHCWDLQRKGKSKGSRRIQNDRNKLFIC